MSAASANLFTTHMEVSDVVPRQHYIVDLSPHVPPEIQDVRVGGRDHGVHGQRRDGLVVLCLLGGVVKGEIGHVRRVERLGAVHWGGMTETEYNTSFFKLQAGVRSFDCY